MKTVYVVTDLNTGDVVSVHESMWGARDAVIEHLRDNCGYTAMEWEDFADAAGYDNVTDFQDAIRSYSDYDDVMQMKVDACILKD